MPKGRLRIVRDEKFCSRCEDVKPLDAFGLRAKGYLQSWCKDCHNDYDAQRRGKKAA